MSKADGKVCETFAYWYEFPRDQRPADVAGGDSEGYVIMNGYCQRYPKAEVTAGWYWCGEWQEDD